MTGICGEKNLRMNIKNRQVFFFFLDKRYQGLSRERLKLQLQAFA